MTELSGWVGVRATPSGTIVEVRDLGPDPIGVKDNMVVQIADRPSPAHQWDFDAGEWTLPPKTRVPKDVIWRRATDEEAEQMAAALAQQTARLQQIYAGAAYIDTSDELYTTLQTAMVGLFGDARAAELLEPTE